MPPSTDAALSTEGWPTDGPSVPVGHQPFSTVDSYIPAFEAAIQEDGTETLESCPMAPIFF